MNRLLLHLSRNLRVREIRLGRQRYLERHFVCRIHTVTVYLHRYLGCDGDREVHDHPWRWALGIPLTGGYDEERVVTLCPRKGWLSRTVPVRPWRWNWIGAMTFHRIASVQPGTWTLFLHGDRLAGWGFLRRRPDHTVDYAQPHDTSMAAGWTQHGLRAQELRDRLELERALRILR